MSNFAAARKMIGMALFTAFICLFVQISFYSLINSFSTEVVAYKIYDVTAVDESNPEGSYVTTYNKEDMPEDLDTQKFRALAVYSKMPKSAKVVEVVLSTVCSVGILFCTAGTVLANTAAKDRGASDFDGAAFDKTRGFKIGLISAVPSAVFYVAAIILRMLPQNKASDWFFWVYRFIILGPVKPINDIITNVETSLHSAEWWWVIASGLYIILFIGFSGLMYLICYNEDSWVSKLLYNSTKKQTNVRRLGGR